MESKKVRSMYEIGEPTDWVSGGLSAPEITTSKLGDVSTVDEPERLVIPAETGARY
jgi:hypothetical protein